MRWLEGILNYLVEVKFRYFDLKFFRQKRTARNLKIEQTIEFKPLITKDFWAALGLLKSWKVFTQHCYVQNFIWGHASANA